MYEYRAQVINIVDGDTYDLQVDLGFMMQANIRVRLRGLDTDELRGGTEETKQKAREATLRVFKLIFNRNVIIRTYKLGIYGRWEADILIQENGELQSLADILRAEGYEKLATV